MSSFELESKLMAYVNERTIPALINKLNALGVSGVDWARANGNYQDRTGNLRNSISYAVLKDGAPVGSIDSAVLSGITEFHKLDLVVYAGMYYGLYVEAKGYTVLPSWSDLSYKQVLGEGGR